MPLPRSLGSVRGFISTKKPLRSSSQNSAKKITFLLRPVSVCYACTLTLSHTYPHSCSDAQKLDLYELVYFVRPQAPGANNDTEAVVKRFKDKTRCMKIFRTHNKVSRRCLLTRAIYGEVEVDDLGVTTTDVWRVRSCRPKLRRDQIVRGLSNLPGVSLQLALKLAKRIPRTAYPASIEACVLLIGLPD